MIVIEKNMINALKCGKNFKCSNTEVMHNNKGSFVNLYDTIIYAKVKGVIYFSDGGIRANDMDIIVKKVLDRYGLLNCSDTHRYMMLGRLDNDCRYYLGYGNRCKKHLWTLSAIEQIKIMRALWLYLDVKPEWLTMEQINIYAKDMLN